MKNAENKKYVCGKIAPLLVVNKTTKKKVLMVQASVS